MSDESLYAIISSVLAVFDIKPPIDAEGRPSRLKAEVTTGLISYDVQLRVLECKLTVIRRQVSLAI